MMQKLHTDVGVQKFVCRAGGAKRMGECNQAVKIPYASLASPWIGVWASVADCKWDDVVRARGKIMRYSIL